MAAASASVVSMRKVADTLWCRAFISVRSLACPSNASSRANSIWRHIGAVGESWYTYVIETGGCFG